MSRIYDNGVYRDMTAEEESIYVSTEPEPAVEPELSLEEQISQLRAALDALLNAK